MINKRKYLCWCLLECCWYSSLQVVRVTEPPTLHGKGETKTYWRKRWTSLALPSSACLYTTPCIAPWQLQLHLSHTHKAVFIFSLSSKWSWQLTSGMFALDKAMALTFSVSFAYIFLHETNCWFTDMIILSNCSHVHFPVQLTKCLHFLWQQHYFPFLFILKLFICPFEM